MPLNELFTLGGGRLFNPTKGKHVLKRAESPPCEVDTLGILVCNFSMFFKVLRGRHFRKSLQSLHWVTDFSQRNF